MQIEILSFLGAIIILMLIFAEISKRGTAGVVGSLFILILGAMIMADGIQILTGTTIYSNESLTDVGLNFNNGTLFTVGCDNCTANMTTLFNSTDMVNVTHIRFTNSTTLNNYKEYELPFMNNFSLSTKSTLGAVFMLLGLYGILTYSQRFKA